MSKKLKRSAKTLAERYGFKDPELTTPEHDAMVLWLLDKNNICKMLEALRWKKPTKIEGIICEYAILGYNNYNIGFIDARFIATLPCVYKKSNGTIEDSTFDVVVCVEVKVKVTSIGELLRQINMYRSHVKECSWIVMTKTKGLKDVLASQHIEVYEWEGQ